MKTLLILFAFFTFARCYGQTVNQDFDSSFVAKEYLPLFSKDTGLYLKSPTHLVDKKGKKRTLSEFKGKILYIDVWYTKCAPCIANFPLSKKLKERIKFIHLDTAIQFINLCVVGSQSDWKKLIKEHQPEGVNLYSNDTSLYKTWKLESYPNYMIIDKDGKIMSLNGPHVDNSFTDYILYAATKGVKPAVSIFTEVRQMKSIEMYNRFTDDAEGNDYKIWYNSIINKIMKDRDYDYRIQ